MRPRSSYPAAAPAATSAAAPMMTERRVSLCRGAAGVSALGKSDGVPPTPDGERMQHVIGVALSGVGHHKRGTQRQCRHHTDDGSGTPDGPARQYIGGPMGGEYESAAADHNRNPESHTQNDEATDRPAEHS